MAAALPVVTTPVGAIPDIITKDVHGFINDPNDVQAFIRDVSLLLDNPALRHKMGKHCYELVSNDYNLDIVFQRFSILWDRTIIER